MSRRAHWECSLPWLATIALLSTLAGCRSLDYEITARPNVRKIDIPISSATNRSTKPSIDHSVKQAQAPGELPLPLPDASVPIPATTNGALNGQSLALEVALYGALTSNPDLVALRQNAPATAEAVEVARRFPATLNPTIWLDMRPLNYARVPGHGGPDQKDAYVNISWRQPIELGNQTQHRYEMAKAAYSQAQWGIVQAEVLALVQTFRFFETAAYRREKLKLAERLAVFNRELVDSLRKALDENLVLAADVRIAEVELRALQQQVEAARQDYATALADLHNQLGTPETAGTAEPFGEFTIPPYIPEIEDERLVRVALQTRPEIHAARAAVEGAGAAVRLAEGDRVPTIVAGPEYQRNETGTDFYGFILVMPIPVVNDGTPLVRQRQAELRRACVALQQMEQRTVAQVRTAVAKWNAAQRLVKSTSDAVADLDSQVTALEKLFQENQIDIAKLLQARQRLIQLENAKLDATWQATQAQADLLTAMGASHLLNATRSSPTD